jgi:Amidohydrolase family
MMYGQMTAGRGKRLVRALKEPLTADIDPPGPRARARSRLAGGRQARRLPRPGRTGEADRLPAGPQSGAGGVHRWRTGVCARRGGRGPNHPAMSATASTARVPAMVNAHSHAFQLDLRGIGERSHPGDDFWSWRTEMYRLAGSHDPASMGAVGDRVYRAMAAAGYGAVGEFHYVVHQPNGLPYAEPNAMAIALAEAALAAGLEIVLLPVAYHRAGPGRGAKPDQRRFCDPDVETFLERMDALRAWGDARAYTWGWGCTASARCPLTGSPPWASTPSATHWSDTSTLASSAGNSTSAGPRMAARRSSCWSALASSARARASCTASTSQTAISPGSPTAGRSSSAARPHCATAMPACAWRSVPTSRSGSTRSRGCASEVLFA